MTKDTHGGSESPAPPAPVEAWVRTADALLCGLNHALSNRVSSLGIISLAGDGRPLDAREIERLSREMAKLEELLRLYRLLERHDGSEPEPVQLADAVADALALIAHHPTVRDVVCSVSGDTDTPPVLMAPSALVHAVLFLLCEAAARLGTEPGSLHLSYAGDSDWVTVVIQTRMTAAGGLAVQQGTLPALQWLTRNAYVAQAESPTVDGGVRFEMRIATLAHQRGLERDA